MDASIAMPAASEGMGDRRVMLTDDLARGKTASHDSLTELQTLPPAERKRLQLESMRWVTMDETFTRDMLGTDQRKDREYLSDFREQDFVRKGSYYPMWALLSPDRWKKYGSAVTDQVGGIKTDALRWFLLKFVVTKNSPPEAKANITHVTFNKSRFSIRDEIDLQRFYELYAIFLSRGYNMYFVERPDEHCAMRMIMDLDFKHKYALEVWQVEVVMRVVQSVISEWFPSRSPEDLVAIVCGAPYKFFEEKVEDGSAPSSSQGSEEVLKLVKVGVHVIWKNLYVSLEQALWLRYNIMLTLEKTFGRRNPPANSWDDVVDATVYNYSGLRMVGSKKVHDCPHCKGDEGNLECSVCQGFGVVGENRTYRPLFVLKGNGERDREMETEFTQTEAGLYKLVLATVIRSNIPLTEVTNDRIGFVPPAKAEPLPPPSKRGPVKKRKKRSRDESERKESNPELIYSDDDHGLSDLKRGNGFHKLDDGEVSYSLIEEVVRSFAPEYAETMIKDVMKSTKKVTRTTKKETKSTTSVTYLIRVHGPGCRFCTNVGRAHNSNTVWFEMKAEGIRQRCFKRGDNIAASRFGTSCEHYQTQWLPLPPSLRKRLFGDETPNRTKDPEDLFAVGAHRISGILKTIRLLNRGQGRKPIDKVLHLDERQSLARSCDGSGLGIRGLGACKDLGFEDAAKRVKLDRKELEEQEEPRLKYRDMVRDAMATSMETSNPYERMVAFAKQAADFVGRLSVETIEDWKRDGCRPETLARYAPRSDFTCLATPSPEVPVSS